MHWSHVHCCFYILRFLLCGRAAPLHSSECGLQIHVGFKSHFLIANEISHTNKVPHMHTEYQLKKFILSMCCHNFIAACCTYQSSFSDFREKVCSDQQTFLPIWSSSVCQCPPASTHRSPVGYLDMWERISVFSMLFWPMGTVGTEQDVENSSCWIFL